MIRLLVVDDSALMRKCLVDLFGKKLDFELRTARNGADALKELETFKPDVITLDINMPEMDGLTCLSHIMQRHPCPVVMVSSLTTKGALATFEALALGAVDFVGKPDGTMSLNLDSVARELEIKVRSAVGCKVRGRDSRPSSESAAGKPTPVPPRTKTSGKAVGIVVIGVSTGGPQTLELILPKLPADFPWPVVVAQHMPSGFTKSFAERLDRMSALNVVEVSRQLSVVPGTVYIARGDADVTLVKRGEEIIAAPRPSATSYLWHPSVDALVYSALEVAAATSIIGVLLTGMGNDGAQSMAQVKGRGGKTIAESQSSCVVFGMPNELIKLGGASLVMEASRVAQQLVIWLRN
jgi:two-component system chemotaxis response regulator CheB